jgi:large subunit ribosomal protein L10
MELTGNVMKKEDKSAIVAEVTERISRAKSMFFTDFSGLTVEQMNELRREFRKAKIDYKVVKNTLVKKALASVGGYDSVYESLVGPTGIALGYDDPVAPAKIIKKYFEKNKKLALKACIVERQFYPGAKLDELAQLPSRGEMIAGFLGSIQAPISGIVGSIDAVIRNMVLVLDALEKKNVENSSSEALPSSE